MNEQVNQEKYNALQYPEGLERFRKEMLSFLPEDDAVRHEFMKGVLQTLMQF